MARDLLADTRCSQPVLDFLNTTHVRRRVPPPAEDDEQSEALEWELHERREKEKRGRIWGGFRLFCRGTCDTANTEHHSC